MNAEQIRAEAIEVLARTEWDAMKASLKILDGEPADADYAEAPDDNVIKVALRQQATRDVDALAAAGLLPTESRWKTSGEGGDSPGWWSSKAQAMADWDRVQEKCAEMYPDWEYEAPILKREYSTGWREVSE